MVSNEIILCCWLVRTIHNEQFWQWGVQGDSVTEVAAVSLEASPPDEVEWQVDEDDEDEAEVEGEEDEVEHNEVKEDILREAQQVIHGDWFWNSTHLWASAILWPALQPDICNCSGAVRDQTSGRAGTSPARQSCRTGHKDETRDHRTQSHWSMVILYTLPRFLVDIWYRLQSLSSSIMVCTSAHPYSFMGWALKTGYKAIRMKHCMKIYTTYSYSIWYPIMN